MEGPKQKMMLEAYYFLAYITANMAGNFKHQVSALCFAAVRFNSENVPLHTMNYEVRKTKANLKGTLNAFC